MVLAHIFLRYLPGSNPDRSVRQDHLRQNTTIDCPAYSLFNDRMSNPRIYIDPSHIDHLSPGADLTLPTVIGHRLVHVLRRKNGATITLFNGDGFEYPSTLTNLNKKQCTIAHNQTTNRTFKIMIGPEGGFSEAEQQTPSHHWQPCSLGPHILRTETAASVAIAWIQCYLAKTINTIKEKK